MVTDGTSQIIVLVPDPDDGWPRREGYECVDAAYSAKFGRKQKTASVPHTSCVRVRVNETQDKMERMGGQLVTVGLKGASLGFGRIASSNTFISSPPP